MVAICTKDCLQTIVPFGRLMDGWMFRGSLEEDRMKEFYVSRNDDVSMNDSKFWTDGFSIDTVAQDIICPLFEKRNMERIFFTGGVCWKTHFML